MFTELGWRQEENIDGLEVRDDSYLYKFSRCSALHKGRQDSTAANFSRPPHAAKLSARHPPHTKQVMVWEHLSPLARRRGSTRIEGWECILRMEAATNDRAGLQTISVDGPRDKGRREGVGHVHWRWMSEPGYHGWWMDLVICPEPTPSSKVDYVMCCYWTLTD